jgi:hypothetical protein
MSTKWIVLHIVSTITMAMLLMWILPESSFDPRDRGFYEAISIAVISDVVFIFQVKSIKQVTENKISSAKLL